MSLVTELRRKYNDFVQQMQDLMITIATDSDNAIPLLRKRLRLVEELEVDFNRVLNVFETQDEKDKVRNLLSSLGKAKATIQDLINQT